MQCSTWHQERTFTDGKGDNDKLVDGVPLEVVPIGVALMQTPLHIGRQCQTSHRIPENIDIRFPRTGRWR